MALFTADDFRADPYGYVTNQLSHFAVGLVGLAYLPSALWIAATGELPSWWSIVVWAAAIYAAYELIDQGWRGWDTVEDWCFVVVYGVFNPVLMGSFVTRLDATDIVSVARDAFFCGLPGLAVMAAHLIVGALTREYRRRAMS